jgi:hypothetical protein
MIAEKKSRVTAFLFGDVRVTKRPDAYCHRIMDSMMRLSI